MALVSGMCVMHIKKTLGITYEKLRKTYLGHTKTSSTHMNLLFWHAYSVGKYSPGKYRDHHCTSGGSALGEHLNALDPGQRTQTPLDVHVKN